MPTVKGIKKTMKEKGILDELINKIDFPKPQGNQAKEVISLINQMDDLLSCDQCLEIMEEQGCCKTINIAAPFIEFNNKHGDKSIDEKVELLNKADIPHKVPCHINSDGTLSIAWGILHDEKYQCVCRTIKRLYKENGCPVNVTKTFCGCCAGHVRHTYQHALGVKLKLKEIVSSPISSDGKEGCKFLFDIL